MSADPHMAEALALLEECRNAAGACFRVIHSVGTEPVMARFEAEMLAAGVTPGFGVRVESFIRKHKPAVPTCRVCGCTDTDCRQCVEKTGAPCHWVEPDLCSACVKGGPR